MTTADLPRNSIDVWQFSSGGGVAWCPVPIFMFLAFLWLCISRPLIVNRRCASPDASVSPMFRLPCAAGLNNSPCWAMGVFDIIEEWIESKAGEVANVPVGAFSRDRMDCIVVWTRVLSFTVSFYELSHIPPKQRHFDTTSG
jgi:hypothetical protein